MFQENDNLNLLVALNCTGTSCTSQGSYKDENDINLSFNVENNILEITNLNDDIVEINLYKINLYYTNETLVCFVEQNSTLYEDVFKIDFNQDLINCVN